MQEHLPRNVQTGEALDRAVLARHGDVAHALSGLLAEPGDNQFVVAPHRAVEEDERRALDPRLQIVGDAGAGGEEEEIFAARLVCNAQSQRVTCCIVATWMGLALKIPCALAGNRKGQHLKA